jgi:hypothetical protein
VIGGLGLYRLKASAEFQDVDISDTQTKLGLNFGAGLTFNLAASKRSSRRDSTRSSPKGSNLNFIPLSYGFKF